MQIVYIGQYNTNFTYGKYYDVLTTFSEPNDKYSYEIVDDVNRGWVITLPEKGYPEFIDINEWRNKQIEKITDEI